MRISDWSSDVCSSDLFDTSNDLMNPTTGYRLKLSLSPETSVRGAVRPYARTLVEASAYYPVSDSLTIAGRVRAGSILGVDRDDQIGRASCRERGCQYL